ncbi:MAG: hypothetical protein ACLP8X_06275, partial [Streptosporangiaceae bacterium]
MVFVVDDLGAWLVGLLADAALKKLTTLIRGSEPDRALRQAAKAAVQQTIDELCPAGGEQAGQLATAINKAFKNPMPRAPLAGKATLLEALQAGIAEQLADLDHVSPVGTGRSPGALLGVPAGVLAEKLSGYLVWEIMVRGSRGGPLTPLADQLNHDQEYLQGQRLEGMIALLADAVQAGRAPAAVS